MAKYKFYICTGSKCSEKEEIMEIPSNYTDEDIQKQYDIWVGNNTELTWWKVEDDE